MSHPSDKCDSLWSASTPYHEQYPVLRSNIDCDVAIIGAGFTGCSAALHLSEAGVNTCLLDAQTIGHGGSGRNVGLVNAGLWLEPQQISQQMGEAAAQRLNKALVEGPRQVFDLIKKHHIDCEPTQSGTLHCAHSAKGLKQLQSRLKQYLHQGANVELLDKTQTCKITGASGLHGALLDHRAGTIQPLSYVRGLAKAAHLAGAKIHEKSPITDMRYHQGRWHLSSANATITARHVVHATHAYGNNHGNGGILTQPARYIVMHYFQLATAPMDAGMMQSILPQAQGCWDTAAVMSSFRKDKSNRLIIGALGQLGATSKKIHLDWANRKLAQLYPALKNSPIEFSWQGRIAMTQDHLPRLVEWGKNALSVYGFNGRGISPGTVFGQTIAQYIISGDVSGLPLAPQPSFSKESNPQLKQCFFETAAAADHFIKARL